MWQFHATAGLLNLMMWKVWGQDARLDIEVVRGLVGLRKVGCWMAWYVYDFDGFEMWSNEVR